MIKAQVWEKSIYTINIEGVEYECRLESQWEGMACFRDLNGRKIVLDWDDSILERLSKELNDLLDKDEDEAHEHLIIKVHPNMIPRQRRG